jgi:hypothetical protein
MKNRALRAARRHGFIPSSQLCNRLLHNWTHPPFWNVQYPRGRHLPACSFGSNLDGFLLNGYLVERWHGHARWRLCETWRIWSQQRLALPAVTRGANGCCKPVPYRLSKLPFSPSQRGPCPCLEVHSPKCLKSLRAR